MPAASLAPVEQWWWGVGQEAEWRGRTGREVLPLGPGAEAPGVPDDQPSGVAWGSAGRLSWYVWTVFSRWLER